MIRLTGAELQFLQDYEARMFDANAVRMSGDDRSRLLMSKAVREAGHALIAAADAIALRVADEAEEVARHGN